LRENTKKFIYKEFLPYIRSTTNTMKATLLKNYKLTIIIGLGLVVFVVFMTLNTTPEPQQKQLTQQTTNVKFKKGEQLYRANCIACHASNMKDAETAPALGGITKKRDLQWLYAYTRNPLAPQFKNDPIVSQIRAKGWGVMPAAPHLKNEDLDAMYYYIEERYQMTLKGIPVPLYFRFNESENQNAQWCIHIVKHNQPILFVRHTAKKQWFFGCKEKHTPSEWKSTTLHQVFEKDTAVDDASFLPEGFYAKRTSKGSEWDFFKE
jgi:mono/diheme cytochrome c family protein